MPYLPILDAENSFQQVTDTFLGYNHNPKIADGELYDTKNLTGDFYPLLANRRKRSSVAQLSDPGGLLAKEQLAFVDGGKLYYGGNVVPGINLTPGEKQLVSMGAYLVVWPDRVYVNTKDLSDHGNMDAETSSTQAVRYTICDWSGKNYGNVPTTKPQNPQGGEYWIDTSTTPHSLKFFNANTSSWTSVATVYVRIQSANIGKKFAKGDAVDFSGISYNGEDETVRQQYEALNGNHIVQAVGANYVVIVGLVDINYTQEEGAVALSRTAPDMDYITEAGNRLWGCKYGVVDGKSVNEIYCSKLGDFKNWRVYQGLSTDSYAASVGTDGKWTGAATHLGYPIFFKENCLHKVFVSSQGAHQINDTACRGVQDGCAKSLAIVGERLYYKSHSGIMVYDGSLPECVSTQLGSEKYAHAAAGGIDDKYYVSMQSAAGEWSLFVLDVAKGLWYREDDTHAIGFTRSANELFYIDADTKRLMAVNGTVGDEEALMEWGATTGIIGYATVEQKYVSRFNFRMRLPKGSAADFYIEYDSDEIWHHCGHMEGTGTKTFLLPVRPRRCDHFRLRIEGEGEVRLYSMAKMFEAGSDFT